jgi:hypothetical protein
MEVYAEAMLLKKQMLCSAVRKVNRTWHVPRFLLCCGSWFLSVAVFTSLRRGSPQGDFMKANKWFVLL